MSHKMRLGPIAIFFTIVAAVLATLAILTVSTSRADVVLAERFAQTTSIRYALEADGNRFLAALEEAPEDAASLEGVTILENGNYQYTTQRDAYHLTVEVTPGPDQGTYEIVSWKIGKDWDEKDAMGELWGG
ncbi:MAG: hypothetical protein E7236_08390 [Lachnospiraceae bacterium]|nr:hypothetical protein [Lachnospiraceae bacterium]